jgi:hypothetical protein
LAVSPKAPDLSSLAGRFTVWLEASYGTAASLVLASEGAISQRTIQNWKAGVSEPGADALRILHGLGCNIIWLVTGDAASMWADTAKGRLFAERHASASKAAKNDAVVKVKPTGRDATKLGAGRLDAGAASLVHEPGAAFYAIGDIPDLPVRTQSKKNALALIAKRMEIVAEKKRELDGAYDAAAARIDEETERTVARLLEIARQES